MFAPIAEFRSRLRAGEVLLGTAIALTDPFSSEALADSVDFLWIDQEHTPMSPEALRAHLTALRGRGKPGLVRVTEGSTPFIKPVLDAGASGVVAPQVKSAEEVRRVVARLPVHT
jgi:2-keto-3-deoxy-L-rhamnonate aldolase RhmA